MTLQRPLIMTIGYQMNFIWISTSWECVYICKISLKTNTLSVYFPWCFVVNITLTAIQCPYTTQCWFLIILLLYSVIFILLYKRFLRIFHYIIFSNSDTQLQSKVNISKIIPTMVMVIISLRLSVTVDGNYRLIALFSPW